MKFRHQLDHQISVGYEKFAICQQYQIWRCLGNGRTVYHPYTKCQLLISEFQVGVKEVGLFSDGIGVI